MQLIYSVYHGHQRTSYAGLEANPAFDAASHPDQNARAFRQMNFFFDVDKYQQDRALDRAKPKQNIKLSKKQLEAFKQKKIDKKRKSLLARMGPDLWFLYYILLILLYC